MRRENNKASGKNTPKKYKKTYRSIRKYPSRRKKIIDGVLRVRASMAGFIEHPKRKSVLIEIPFGFLKTALHGDLVRVHIDSETKGGRVTGEILEILARRKNIFSGEVKKVANSYFLIPDDPKMYKDILIPKRNLREHGDCAIYKIN